MPRRRIHPGGNAVLSSGTQPEEVALDPALADLRAIDSESAGATFAKTRAVIVEVQLAGVFARRERVIRGTAILVLRLLRRGVCAPQMTVDDLRFPVAAAPILRDERSIGAGI
jgi:hypothetical protein